MVSTLVLVIVALVAFFLGGVIGYHRGNVYRYSNGMANGTLEYRRQNMGTSTAKTATKKVKKVAKKTPVKKVAKKTTEKVVKKKK